ncbi:hypothetical protein GCM10017044_21970 [Kordiimonas sediminis]|uniref:DUF2336 domain-containing protein n=1 Tax=Kordiimonas sediminis TaxID=1735581 RepID=A0A919AUF4_9PROT|nr:DUF2336 domain-containing protein [Kordiimonas sediminis]GHF26582.1 hypothetical protein GCM10017044_21970 [Kordiimonas sediminis]
MPSKLINADELKHVSLVARVEIARKVGRILSRKPSAEDMDAALELANLLVQDVSVSVREAMSKAVVDCLFLPKEVVKTIAEDISQVSMPFLMASKAVDDALLESIIRSHENVEVQEAIAQRKGISEIVCFALCDEGTEEAVEALMENESADVSERSCDRVVKRFGTNASILECLAKRSDLPLNMVEKIIFKVSEQYGQYLMQRFNLAPDYASYLVSLTEREVFAQALEVSPQHEVMNYLGGLHKIKELTPNVMLTYLQNNHMRLFIYSLAVVLDLPADKLEGVLGKGDKQVLSKLLRQCGYSQSVSGVLMIAYERMFR